MPVSYICSCLKVCRKLYRFCGKVCIENILVLSLFPVTFLLYSIFFQCCFFSLCLLAMFVLWKLSVSTAKNQHSLPSLTWFFWLAGVHCATLPDPLWKAPKMPELFTHTESSVILSFETLWDSNAPLCQYLLGVKICCTGTFCLCSDRWVSLQAHRAVIQRVTGGIVRGAGLGTPAPSPLTHVIQGVPFQRGMYYRHLLHHQKHQLLLDFGLNINLPSWNQDSDKVSCTSKVFPATWEKQELHRYHLGRCCAGFLWQLLEPSRALLGWGPLQ